MSQSKTGDSLRERPAIYSISQRKENARTKIRIFFY